MPKLKIRVICDGRTDHNKEKWREKRHYKKMNRKKRIKDFLKMIGKERKIKSVT